MENQRQLKIRVSALTANTLGLKNYKTQASSQQAYFMLGEKCQFSCSFCSQARNSASDTQFLSRVTWPAFPMDEVIPALRKTVDSRIIKKICFQVVSYPGYFDDFLFILGQIKGKFDIPVSASISVHTEFQAEQLFTAGLYTLGFAIDCISKENYKKIKKRDFTKDKTLLLKLAEKYPGRIATHVIAGLSETNRELIEFYDLCLKKKIIFALFSFTPLKGTEMENSSMMAPGEYRAIQFILAVLEFAWLLNKEYYEEIYRGLTYDDRGNFTGIKNFSSLGTQFFRNRVFDEIEKGKFMETRGCPYCNRPYYNERPGSFIYNHPRIPEEKEIEYWVSKLSKTYFE